MIKKWFFNFKFVFIFLFLFFAFFLIISHFHIGNFELLNYSSLDIPREIASDITRTSYKYDAGPDKNFSFGEGLIDLNSEIPSFPAISEQIMRFTDYDGKLSPTQKFRPAYGPIPWRMRQPINENTPSVKILFIGQDGTHIAEAAGRPATAGFGGRAQDLAAYFGVTISAAFINTYAFTIKGQYGGEAPYIDNNGGTPKLKWSSFVREDLWVMTHEGPIGEWRGKLIDWIITNNDKKDGINMIVTFGGAARDAIGAYIEARGGKVGTRNNDAISKDIMMPMTKPVSAGSNFEFIVPLDRQGNDLYPQLASGQKLDYKKDDKGNAPGQDAAKQALTTNFAKAMKLMAFTKGGPMKNGLLNPAELGGYSTDKIEINKRQTHNLKGLELKNGHVISNDIIVVDFPHPTSLSKMLPAQASDAIAKGIARLNPQDAGVLKQIKPDPGMENYNALYSRGKPYQYGRTDIPNDYYDFGAPAVRMVPKSDANRMTEIRGGNVIAIGKRQNYTCDIAKLNAMTGGDRDNPPQGISNEEMFTARARSLATRYIFDPGPGIEYAKLMKDNLDLYQIYQPKGIKCPPSNDTDRSVDTNNGGDANTDDGEDNAKADASGENNPLIKCWDGAFEKDGINAFNVKTHPRVGDFGHYRGTFKNPIVLIIADPDGYDDLITSRALTGTRGQYLQGIMNDLGIPTQYLVIKTVPFGMNEATDTEWNAVKDATMKYRDQLIGKILSENKLKLVITDGKWAESEFFRITKNNPTVPHVSIERNGTSNDSGLASAIPQILKVFPGKSIKTPRMDIIPRAHLPYYSRTWEGTTGDRVIGCDYAVPEKEASKPNAKEKGPLKPSKGIVFAEVAPKWAWRQAYPRSIPGVAELKKRLNDNGFPAPEETVGAYLQRTGK